MGELISCGMTREQIEAEAAEAERETAEYEAKRKADWEAYLASLSVFTFPFFSSALASLRVPQRPR